jgi:3-carboxy-cis,cis-muconate cycloisomerase
LPCGDGSSGGELFGLALTTDAMAAATSDISWCRRMLDFEIALATAEGTASLVPNWAVEEITKLALDSATTDLADLGRQARLVGTPAPAFVALLRGHLSKEAAPWLHFGATSQDAVDTAMMLMLRDAFAIVSADLGRAAAAAAQLAERHRGRPMVARTVLQQAVPTTFGRKAAGWLVALNEGADTVRYAGQHRLAVQLGGPAGTLSALGRAGPTVVQDVASLLGLAVPVLPWHTDRSRVVVAAGALVLCAGTAAKIALDVSLLMQNEVDEVREPPLPGRGASSSMAHKRNPSMATAVNAAWRRALGSYGVILGAMAQEHERAAGAWQAEPATMSELCRSAGGAISVVADMLEGLEVNTEAMAKNLAASVVGSEAAISTELLVDKALADHRKRQSHD